MVETTIRIIYIPNRYDEWNKLPLDLRHCALSTLKRELNDNIDEYYNHDTILIKEPEKALKITWDSYLMDFGEFKESYWGYFDYDDGCYCCPLFAALVSTLKNLKIYNKFLYCRGQTSLIINLNSNKKYREGLCESFMDQLLK